MSEINTSGLKARVIEAVNEHAKLAQVINDSLFSFGELGFHESRRRNTSPRRWSGTALRCSAALPACRPAGWRDGAPAGR